MKLKNVHYEYRGNDTWRIYFKDCQEAEAFENERTDGQKPECVEVGFINSLGIRYYVEAKLNGPFNIMRHYVKDPTTDYFSNDIFRALVKKIEGADSDYIFDEIDLWYVATTDKCYFRICCMYGTWTELFVKNMVARANGYYDTDTAYQGGLCVRRSCCGIGFDPSTYKTSEERIMFSVKNLCRGEADIVKVSAWTNTFIGTNKENEKEYSWNDFKKCMGLLHANGSDIWDIEWKYDKTCPMTGTEVADKLHLYLKPLAYKRLFEKEEREEGKKIWISSNATLWSDNDYLGRVKALTPPPVPYWVNLDEDCKIGFRQKDTDELQKEIDEMTKRIYEKLEIMTAVRDFDVDTAWYDYLSATETAQVLEPEPIIFINHKPMTLTEFNASIKDFSDSNATNATQNKEDNNMKIYWDESLPRIENVRDIVLNGYKYDRSVYYYRVYFERVVDAKNITGRSYYQDMDKHCWYYMMIASTAELSEEMKGSIKTLYLTHDKNELEKTNYYINWKAMYAPLKAGAHFEMKMTAQVNEEQLKVWEAALGIGNLPKHKKEKTIGEVVNEFNEEQKKVLYYLIAEAQKSGKAKTAVTPTKILIQGTATIIWWSDGDKTVVKCQKGDKMDPEKGIAMAVMKKFMGTNKTGSNYLDFAKKPIAEYEKQKQEAAKKRKQASEKKRRAQKKEADANKEV